MFKVSIIIATHSRPQLLPRAVQSAFAAGTGVEVIVVDDASTDETAEVCKTLAGIKYIRVDRNQHTAGARNIGIINSTAPYIGFLDDDDWRLPNILDEQVQILDRDQQIGLVYAPYLFADQKGNILDEPAVPSFCPQGDIFWEILNSNPIGCLTAVFRKSCISSVGLLDQTISGVDDLDLWIRIAEIYSIAAIDKPAAVWRKPTTESGQGSSDVFGLMSKVVKTFNNKWMILPRAVKEKHKLIEVHSKFITYTMNKMFYEAAQSNNLQNSLIRIYQVINSYPRSLSEVRTYKIIFKILLSKIIGNKIYRSYK